MTFALQVEKHVLVWGITVYTKYCFRRKLGTWKLAIIVSRIDSCSKTPDEYPSGLYAYVTDDDTKLWFEFTFRVRSFRWISII